MAGRKIGTAAASVALAVALMTACQPPPPRLAIVVDSGGSLDDVAPGDGRCSTGGQPQECTLTAAITEANASPTGADITLPALAAEPGYPPPHYSGDLTVTGDVRVIGDGETRLGGVHVTVAPGARLHMSRFRGPAGSILPPVSFLVEGTLVLDRALVGNAGFFNTSGNADRPALEVAASGTALVGESVLSSDHGAGVVVNAGVLVAARTSIAPVMVCPGGTGCFSTGVAVHTADDGQTHLASTAAHAVGPPQWAHPLASCTGTPPVSHGYVHLEEPCGGAPAVGDSSGDALAAFAGEGLTALSDTSPLIDAVPLTHQFCDEATVDVVGAPRGLDSDGDGTPGCEIGAVER